MMTSQFVVARKSAWTVSIATICIVLLAAAFSVWSIQDGFDVVARPGMVTREWLWRLAAYGASPLLVVAACAHLARLAAQRFAAATVREGVLQIVGEKRSMKVADLIAIEISLASVAFISKDGLRLEMGRLGLLDGWKGAVDRLCEIKPDVEIREDPRGYRR